MNRQELLNLDPEWKSAVLTLLDKSREPISAIRQSMERSVPLTTGLVSVETQGDLMELVDNLLARIASFKAVLRLRETQDLKAAERMEKRAKVLEEKIAKLREGVK